MSPDCSWQQEFHGAKGETVSMSAKVLCSRTDCSERVVTSLGEREFCFDHFCIECYELLERSHRGAELAFSSEEFSDELLALDELARRALEVSFSRHTLNNLDRARLLDILLWAGELTSSLRHRRPAATTLERLESVGAGSGREKMGSRGRSRAN